MNTRRWFLSLLPASLAGWFANPQATIAGANELSIKIEGDVDERAKELVKGLMEPLAADLKQSGPYYVDADGKKHFPPPGETFAGFCSMPVLPEGLRWHSLGAQTNWNANSDRRAWSIDIVWRPDMTEEEIVRLYLAIKDRTTSAVDFLLKEVEMRCYLHQLGEMPDYDRSEEEHLAYQRELSSRFDKMKKLVEQLRKKT